MNMLAHHEALLIVQASAGLTIAGATASLVSSWAKVRERMSHQPIIAPPKTTSVVDDCGPNELARRIGAEPYERGQ